MDLNQLASDLFGSKRAESGTTPSTVSVMYGIATSDSADGMVSVWLSDNALSPSAAQTEWETVDSYDADAYEGMDESTSIEIPTEVTVFKDDVVRVQLAGAGAAKNPTVVGVVGRGDEQNQRLSSIEADYVKATELDADVARIGFLKADSAVITNLQADTAKVHELTADELSAATAFIAELKAGDITAQTLTADVAKVHNLTADQLSAAAGYISQLTADSVTAQNISAMYGDFATVKANAAKVANLTAQELEADHATIASLDSNYAHITDGVIDNATIGYADVNNLSAHYAEIQNGHINSALINTAAIVDEQVFTVTGNKATLASIDASKINVTNLNADNITVNKINGQTVTGKSISDALSQHETDISTKVDTATFNNTVDGLNDRIDGAIETFTGTVVPTLNNTPASSWNTTKLRDEHVGDVYYVVNAASQQNGYCYRFTKSGTSYSWQLIKDSDVTAALSRLQTAEGKITTFDSDISTLKTDTGELKTKTQSLETSLGDKVDVTTFNELSSDVEENSATITTLSNTVSQKADSSTVTTLSNTVNQVKQTADTNKTSITNLTQTVNQKADSSTVTTLTTKTNTIEQNLNGITTRVGKTESTLETVSNPNLSPFFSMATTDVYNATSNPDGYWNESKSSGSGSNHCTNLSDGWTHYEWTNTGSGLGWLTMYEMAAWRHSHGDLKGNTKYTVLMEFRNVTKSGEVLAYGMSTHPSSWPSMFAANPDTQPVANGSLYFVATTIADPSSRTGNTCTTRTMIKLAAGASLTCDFRVSLYEGEYTGPYKPYVDQTLSNRVKIAETSIEQNAEDITLRATKAEFDALSIGGRNLLLKTGEELDYVNNTEGCLSRRWAYTTIYGSVTFDKNIAVFTKNAYGLDNNTSGLRVMSLTSSGASANSSPGNSTEYGLTFAVGEQYTFSCDVKTSGNRVALSWQYYKTGSNVWQSTGIDEHVPVDNDWHRYSYTFTIPSDFVCITCLGVYCQLANGVTLELKNVKLEKGNRATDWTPAPEDMATAAELKVANDAINSKVSKDGVISSINQSSESVRIQANRIEIDGTTVFTSGTTLSDYVNGVAEDTEVISERVYYRSTSSTKPSAPTSWVADATGNVWNAWTTKVPPLAANKDAGSIKYLYLWTCEQRKSVSGIFLGCTTVQLDENTTVIDGGNIITHSITAEQLNATSINASKSLTIGAFQTSTQTDILNSNVQVGGRNLLINTSNPDVSDNDSKPRVVGTVTADLNHAGTASAATHGMRLTSASATQPRFSFGKQNGTTMMGGLEAGETYTFSADIKWKVYSSAPRAGTIRMYFYNKVEGATSYVNTLNATLVSFTATECESEDYVHVQGTLTIPDTAIGAYLEIRCATTTSSYFAAGDFIELANMKLEKGNKATDWSPAPEDVQGYTDMSVNGVSGQLTDVNDTLTNLQNEFSDKSDVLTQLENNLKTVQDMIGGLQDTTSWLTFTEGVGLVIGDTASETGSYFFTQQTGQAMSFNQMTADGSQQLMVLSGTNGVQTPRVTAEEVVTDRISSDWAINLDGDMFSIDYIGS